ncbi:MAG: dimethylarginine dimethylaminohydrolase family protein [Flavobacteriales bacterium]
MIPVDWNIKDEWQPLEAVMVGIGQGMGNPPSLDDTYDPQSRRHVLAGTFPSEFSVSEELAKLVELLESQGVRVLRPDALGLNQVFTRDIGFIVDDTFIMTHMVEDRIPEQEGLQSMFRRNPGAVIKPPSKVQMEGGDVMPMRDEIWVGYAKDAEFQSYTTARTNEAAIEWFKHKFPHRTVRSFELQKSDTDPWKNALHLDCCIAPLGMGHLMIHKPSFRNMDELKPILQRYPESHVLEISEDEMQAMHCNVLSLSPKTVLSGKGFDRTNEQMKRWGYEVIEADLRETSKMGGLLRCTTLPLRRTPIS